MPESTVMEGNPRLLPAVTPNTKRGLRRMVERDPHSKPQGSDPPLSSCPLPRVPAPLDPQVRRRRTTGSERMRHGGADRTLLAISFAVVSAVTLALIYRDNCVTHSGAWALIVGPVVAGVLA